MLTYAEHSSVSLTSMVFTTSSRTQTAPSCGLSEDGRSLEALRHQMFSGPVFADLARGGKSLRSLELIPSWLQKLCGANVGREATYNFEACILQGGFL